MRSLLDQLENDDAILLMYLADELPAADRATVDRRLAAETRLRDQLGRLRDVHGDMNRAMAAADAAQPLPGTEAATERKLSRSIRQWHADRVAARVQAEKRRSTRIPGRRWPYAVGAVAAVIAMVIWWGLEPVQDEAAPAPNYSPWNEYAERPLIEPLYPMGPAEDLPDSLAVADVEDEMDMVEQLRTLIQ